MKKSDLEKEWWRLWDEYGDKRYNPVAERQIIPGRRFRFDVVFLECKVAIEIQGGTFLRRSAHNTGVGLHRDYSKHNLAILLGWTLLYYDSPSIQKSGRDCIEQVNELLRQKTKEGKTKSPAQRGKARRPARSKAKKAKRTGRGSGHKEGTKRI